MSFNGSYKNCDLFCTSSLFAGTLYREVVLSIKVNGNFKAYLIHRSQSMTYFNSLQKPPTFSNISFLVLGLTTLILNSL